MIRKGRSGHAVPGLMFKLLLLALLPLYAERCPCTTCAEYEASCKAFWASVGQGYVFTCNENSLGCATSHSCRGLSTGPQIVDPFGDDYDNHDPDCP